MAGLEVVVRPVVLPNIRPRSAQSLPPADDPEKGFCEIKGNPAKQINLTNSHSSSMSKSHNVETERRVDEVRVYQQEDDGTINRDNFVDIEVANRIKMQGGKQPAVDGSGPGSGTPGVGSDDAKPGDNYFTYQERVDWFKQYEEAVNTEIREKDKIKKSSNP